MGFWLYMLYLLKKVLKNIIHISVCTLRKFYDIDQVQAGLSQFDFIIFTSFTTIKTPIYSKK